MNKTVLLIMITGWNISVAQNLNNKIIYSRATPPYGNIWINDGYGTDSLLFLNGHAPKVSTNSHHMLYMKTSSPLFYAGQLARLDMITQTDTAWYNGDWIVGYDFVDADSSLIYSYACAIYHATFNNAAINTVVQTSCYDDGPDVRQSDSMIVYHNIQQNLKLVKVDGSNGSNIPNTVSQDVWPVWSNNGQWIAFGKTNANYTIIENIYKIEPNGTNLTQLTFFTPNDSASLALSCGWNANNTAVIFGGRVAGKTSLFAVKADGSGIVDTIPTSAGDDINFVSVAGNLNYTTGIEIKENDGAFNIFPNPVHSEFSINYFTSKSEFLNVSVTDITGKTVSLLMNEKLTAGRSILNFDVPGYLGSGIYFLRLSAPGFSATKKLSVIR